MVVAKAAMQKRNKIKSEIDHGGQTVVVIGDDEEEKTKVKRKKRKHLEDAADQMKTKKTKKKRKKKDSKLNEGPTDHPIVVQSSSDLKSLREAEKIIIESSSDSESIKETGKASKIFKKKRGRGSGHEHGRNHEVPNEDLSEAHLETHSLGRKTCKRTIPESHGDDQGFATTKKKKKKKRKHQPSCSGMLLQSEDNEEESGTLFSKRPKLISQGEVLLSENKGGPILLNATRDCNVVKPKHKGIGCLASVDNQGSSNGIGGEGHARTVGQLKQEHSSQGRAENSVENETTRKKAKKKKKWKKKKAALKAKEVASVLADNQGADSKNRLGPKSERKRGGIEDVAMTQDTEGVRRVTKKRKIQAKADHDGPTRAEDSGGTPTKGEEVAVERTKKRPKEVPVHSGLCGFTGEKSELRVGKRKGEKSGSAQEELGGKKAEAEEGEEEIKVMAIKKGKDEVNVDQLRRQALQEEIDRESGKTKALKEEGAWDTHFGQWSTATFGSSERKNKFLRLLGGFKNGSAPAHSSPAHTTKPNMALARAGEKRLLQSLQTEFDKARDLKQFRGLGLGFQPQTQKRTYIDKYASKSIKFES